MRIFVAGATGVLGRRVVPLLVAGGHDVVAVGRTPEKRRALSGGGARAVDTDLFDAVAVRRAVDGCEAVCNLATSVPGGFRVFLPWAWRPMDRVRRQLSANLVDAALAVGARRFIQESFAPIYADSGDDWIDESSAIRPARYNRSVMAAEASADRFTHDGRAGTVLRFGLLYGPGDAMTMQMIDSVRRGWFPLFGRPEGYTSWCSHDDAAAAVVAALGVPAGIYNVVEDEPMRRRDLGNGIARLLGVSPPRFLPVWMANIGGGVGKTLARSLRISNRKLKVAGKWNPRHATLADGLAAIIADGSRYQPGSASSATPRDRAGQPG